MNIHDLSRISLHKYDTLSDNHRQYCA